MKLTDGLMVAALFAAIVPAALGGQTKAPALPQPDPRYKADILLVVAHPDDDTAVLNYITRASLDEHKRVDVIFTTRGNSGPNAAGMEQGKALADEREMEARHSLALSGITNVWFLRGSDTPTQDVLHSLETLGQGEALEEVVRLVRLTRPEVMITWMPAYVAGENHGDHQASSVVATEAFDLAGDPTAFPSQVSAPRQHTGINNYGEGLHPWQSKKLYYFSDASHQDFLANHGPTYLATDICHARGVPFSTIAREAWEQYATQIDPDLNYYVNMPDHLILARSLVKVSSVDADVWDGIPGSQVTYVPPPGYHPENRPAISVELGGPWAFYRRFQAAHGLTSVLGFVKPQTAMSDNNSLWVPLLLHNDSDEQRELTVHASLPADWNPEGDEIYPVPAHGSYPVQLFLKRNQPLPKSDAQPETLRWSVSDHGKPVGEVDLSVYPEYNGVPQ